MTSRQLRAAANKVEVRSGQRELSAILLPSLIKQAAHEWYMIISPSGPGTQG